MFPVENCKTRWQQILNHYSREKLRRDKETRSGSAASRRRSWPFYQRMQSLLQKNTHQFSKYDCKHCIVNNHLLLTI